MPRYRYVVDEEALVTLLTLGDAEIASLVPHLEALAEQPSARADYYSLDSQGRPIGNRIAGDFLVGYWTDHAGRVLYVLRIDPLAPDRDGYP